MAAKVRNKAVPAVYAMIRKNGLLLMQLRQNTGYEDGNWQVPAGHVEEAELPKKALIREAEEELDIVIRPRDLVLVHTMYRVRHDETGDRADYYFEVTDYRGEIKNKEPHKCVKLEWISPYRMHENTTPHVGVAVEYIERGRPYSELPEEFFRKYGRYKL